MAEPPLLPSKKDVARALLLKGTVFVHLDPRKEGVSVPTWLRGHAQLVLQVGLDMPIPITDLRVDAAGVYGTLSFSRQPFTCVVPWDAVFAMSGDDGKGMVWPESMPPEVAAEVNQAARRAGLSSVPPLLDDDRDGPAPPKPRPRPALLPLEDAPPPRLSVAPAPAQRSPSLHSPLRLEPAPKAAPKSKPGKTGGSKLRKLPPYLRVVK